MHETWADYIKTAREQIEAELAEEGKGMTIDQAEALGYDIIRQYMRQFGNDDRFEVVAVEHRFAVLIPDPDDHSKPIAQLVGTFDLVLRDRETGYIYLWDHKTCTRIEYLHLVIDDQRGTYMAIATQYLRGAGIIGPREEVRGMIYNFIKKSAYDDRPEDELGRKLNKPEKKHLIAALNPIFELTGKESKEQLLALAESEGLKVGGEVSKVQPTPNLYRHEIPMTKKARNNQILRIGGEVRVMQAMRARELPIWKTPTKECVHLCPFFEMCEMEEEGGDVDEYKKMAFRKRDPYFDHRDGAENSKASVTADHVTKKEATHG